MLEAVVSRIKMIGGMRELAEARAGERAWVLDGGRRSNGHSTPGRPHYPASPPSSSPCPAPALSPCPPPCPTRATLVHGWARRPPRC